MDERICLLEGKPLYKHWKKVGIRPHRGINFPLSALCSKQSCGIGEFFDLEPLFDWCNEVGLDTIQLLPLNDSGMDPSPYNSLSSVAIHPIYLSLQKLPNIECHPDLLEEIKKLKALNKTSRIAFQKVLQRKINFLSIYFEKEKNTLLSSPNFETFVFENSWLKPYAVFKVLKEKHQYLHFSLWPKEYQSINCEALNHLVHEFSHEVSFHITLQYLCFLQLSAIKKKAEEKNILLKGDIPILISPDSADVWFESSQFDLHFSVGVPPDQYSSEGQYWGFPMPLWNEMRKNGFVWWKNRLRYASLFYDLYRIDHAVGLFRLWKIPVGKHSSNGKYDPSDDVSMVCLGKELLALFIESSSMLPIAEDLGAVPSIVRTILEEMGVCGTKVMRWEKEGNLFINPKTYPPLSLTCISTHDSTPLGLWWTEEENEARSYAHQKGWEYAPQITFEQRKAILKESLSSSSLFQINLFSEYLALFPELVSPDPKKERINIPGKILATNWTYKLHMPLEDTLSHQGLLDEMKCLLSS